MATTHVFVGLALVAPAAVAVPELATPLAIGAVVGGLLPDVDLVLTHRKTFHFPVFGFLAAGLAVGLAAVAPSAITAGIAACVVSAWVHAATDVLGGGPEMDPWRNPSERAVYDHVRGAWIRPRRLIRYDGAPEDALLATVLAVPALVAFSGSVQWLIVAGVGVSLAYALCRRRLVEWVPDWIE
ncbi:metal-dependent hydrolase [Natronosalvus halobius]|uniref:metal-dependent hydrolase n=1 Tax=Natronosalvus halobius TaxID=2953746 RepID=UPI00209F6F89|nr:metal-dependent hydrolase [Natronosalvus halobius]USZ73412.1 metal-dependent hydrolase [Natronosalvus halobius]